MNIESLDSKTSYKLKTPKSMYGKNYIFTVQAINKNSKMSLLSEPGIFSVNDPFS